MIKLINKALNKTWLSTFLNIFSIYQFFEWLIINIKTGKQMSEYTDFPLGISELMLFIVSIVLWKILNNYKQLKQEINDINIISSIIMYVKSKDILVKGNLIEKSEYDNKYIVDEFIRARQIVQNNFKDKSLNEINKIMLDFYPDSLKNIVEKQKVSLKG